MHDSTSACLTRALAGDQAARGDLLQRHVARLRSFVAPRMGARLRERESVQDVVQSVLREALGDLDALRSRSGITGSGFWHRLARTADNKLKGRGRFWSRHRRTSSREMGQDEAAVETLGDGAAGTPSEAAIRREELERLERAFGELPPAWREVVVLVRILEVPHAEAARRLGRTESATRTLLCRALARLATTLEQDRPRERDQNWK